MTLVKTTREFGIASISAGATDYPAGMLEVSQNVDTRLGAEVVYGEPTYTTLALIAAATNTVIHIPRGANIAVSANTEFGPTVKVIMHPTAKFTVTAGILNFEGPVECKGVGPHFDVSAGAEVIFNGTFDAPRTQMFSGAGLISFGRHKTELVTNGDFTGNANWWTVGSFAYNTDKVTHSLAGGTTALSQPITVSANARYIVRYEVTGVTSITGDTVRMTLGGYSYYAELNDGRACVRALTVNTTGLAFTPTTNFVGNLDNISVRLWKQSQVNTFFPQWWGGTADGVTDNQAAIQAAVNAAYYSGGGTIYLSPGLWGISSRVNLFAYPATKLKGEGQVSALYALSAFPATKVTGYGMIGFGYWYQDPYPAQILEDLRIDSLYNNNDIVHVWTNKNVASLGFSRVFSNGNPATNQIGLHVPAKYCNDAGTELDTPNHDHFVIQDWTFTALRNTLGLGAMYVEVQPDAQRWNVKTARFEGCYAHINFGGLNSIFDQCYFNTPYGSVYPLKANGTGGLYPRVRFTQSGGSNELRSPYFESGTDVYLINDDLSNALTTAASSVLTGVNTLVDFNTTQFLTFVRTPLTSISRDTARQFTTTGFNVYGNPYYGQYLTAFRNSPSTDAYWWIKSGTNLLKYRIKSLTNVNPSVVTINDSDPDLPATIDAIYRECVVTAHQQTLTSNKQYAGTLHANRLTVGSDYAGDAIKFIKAARTYYTTATTISNGATGSITFTVSPAVDRLYTSAIVTPPANAASGVVINHSSLNTAGDTLTVNITNNSGGDLVLTNTYWQIILIGV
jgi:hypothetical protein